MLPITLRTVHLPFLQCVGRVESEVPSHCVPYTSPFCEAKGGRVKRSETQGVHAPSNTPKTLLGIKGEIDAYESRPSRFTPGFAANNDNTAATIPTNPAPTKNGK